MWESSFKRVFGDLGVAEITEGVIIARKGGRRLCLGAL